LTLMAEEHPAEKATAMKNACLTKAIPYWLVDLESTACAAPNSSAWQQQNETTPPEKRSGGASDRADESLLAACQIVGIQNPRPGM
jgi:hypothetical protein